MKYEHEIIKNWFEGYKAFSNEISVTKIKYTKTKIDSLLSGFRLAQEKMTDIERLKTPSYNVFYVMRYILHKEEQIHSPFIGDLLNIFGKHKQNDLFYNEFIKQLKLKTPIDKFKIDEEVYFSVEVEKWIGNGEIDIFISYNSPIKRFAIAIENKIYAKDQETQMERYAEYLEREFPDKFLLLYLTPEDRLPEMPKSIKEERFNKLCEKEELKTITYKKHIVPLLENTLKIMTPNKASSIIEQYLQIIKNNFRHE